MVERTVILTNMRSENHKLAEEKAFGFLKARRPGSGITAKLQKQIAEEQIRTTNVVISLGQRGIPLRGNWDKSEQSEDGNFAFFLNWKSRFGSELKDHIYHSSGNAKHTSPQIQNETVLLCEQAIREQILESIPKYWCIIADETQDCSTTEQINLCVHYTNSENEVCKEFVGFIKVEKRMHNPFRML